jgi:hypothetical protein
MRPHGVKNQNTIDSSVDDYSVVGVLVNGNDIEEVENVISDMPNYMVDW